MSAFSNPWNKCNICKQYFQGQLLIDLAFSCVSFAEATYGHAGTSKWDKLKVLSALRLKISAIFHATNDKHDEKLQPVIPLINNLLSVVNQTKKDLNMSGWIHMPKGSEEYSYYIMLRGNYEAFGYDYLGRAMGLLDEKLANFKKARAIFNLVDYKDLATEVENKMQSIQILNVCDRSTPQDMSNTSAKIRSISEITRITYENNLNEKGINAEATIRSGLNYARSLTTLARTIEAERLATKLSDISRRVHGHDHKITINAVELLDECKERCVLVLPDMKPFLALGYENDGEICVIQGPITEPRNKEDERIHSVQSNLILPEKGCPVICHGLVSASHLNGRLGEVRNVTQDDTGILRLGVVFEKKGVKSALVKPENIRIVFDLPSEE